MTYCFDFNTEPDGIGIIADTRITIETDLGQLQQVGGHAVKVYQFASHAFVAIAGRLHHIAMVLWVVCCRRTGTVPSEVADDSGQSSANIERIPFTLNAGQTCSAGGEP